MNIFNYSKRIPGIYGALMTIGFIILFFAIRLLTGPQIIEKMRVFNIVIFLAGGYFAMKQYKRTHGDVLTYFRALLLGLSVSFIATSIFSVFLFFYTEANHNFYQSLIIHEPMGYYLDPYITAFTMWIEGIFGGLIVTFILANFLYTDTERPRRGEA